MNLFDATDRLEKSRRWRKENPAETLDHWGIETAAGFVPVLGDLQDAAMFGQAVNNRDWTGAAIGAAAAALPFVSAPLIYRGLAALERRVGPVGNVPYDPDALMGAATQAASPAGGQMQMSLNKAAGEKRKLVHTSPDEIKEINCWGPLGENLCFAADEYVMTAKDKPVVYELEIDEDKIIRDRELYDEEIVKDIAQRFGVDEDTAERLLDGRESAWDYGGDAEDDWWVQEQMGNCAKKMGYEACESRDEQGAVWIVPMLGREKDLVRVK